MCLTHTDDLLYVATQQYHPLAESGMLLIHVKDHNNLGRSTPLGRVQIPLQDLCRASANSTSIASTALEKRYPLTPEPWMKKHSQDLGELCIRTEVVGDATVLAEMLQRATKSSPEKMMSVMSFSSLTSDPYMQDSQLNQSLSPGDSLQHLPEYEDEVTEVLERGKEIRTATVIGNSAKWRKEKFQLSLSYPGMFSDSKTDKIEHYTLHLRVHGARALLGAQDAASKRSNGGSQLDTGEYQFHHHRVGRLGMPNAYFTVIPVLGTGELDHAEKKHSLTVYGTRNPSWPEEEFVFGKAKSIATISYLSLHVYSRNLLGESSKSLSLLLAEPERRQEVVLKRHQLFKLAPSGDIADDGYDVLTYDQRVLAFRACQNGGRYFPARVQRYLPFPLDAYVVLFENRIETIDDVRDLFSVDVLGEIKAIRPDGNADLVLLDQANPADAYAKNVPVSLLTPVQSFSTQTTRTLAKPISHAESDAMRWKSLLHCISALKMEVLSVANLPKSVERPGCVVTLMGNPSVATSFSDKNIAVQLDGRMVAKKALVGVDWEVGQPFEMPISYCSASSDVNELHFLANTAMAFGALRDDAATGNRRASTTESQQDVIDDSADVLAHVASILIRVVDQRQDAVPSTTEHETIGFAKIDLASLRNGEQLLHLRLIPTESTPYYKFVGSVNVHIAAVKEAESAVVTVDESQKTSIDATKSDDGAVCGVIEWYHRRAASLPKLLALTAAPRVLSRIARRDVLRASLTPTENAQVDAFHVVLTTVLKRVVSILREIKLFEEFEVLASDAMRAFRSVHTTNADPNSEWIGRKINEMTVETRKDIVLHLEMELLDIAASDLPRVYPALDLSRDEWVKLRATRQRALQDAGGFFVQDRTSTLVLLHPSCFTGEGMVSWILRAPSVLWKDEWTKYCHDPEAAVASRLRWHDPKLEQDPDAMQPPRTRAEALMWLSTLSDAGYMENVTWTTVETEANQSHCVVKDRSDHVYRLREVQRWLTKERRDTSLFPLDLVQELDCYEAHRQTNASAGQDSAGEETDAEHKHVFSKKLTDHVCGFLGMHNALSSVLFSPEVKPTDLLKPVLDKTKELLDDDVLWNWKYALFLPTTRLVYMYESETSSLPFAIVDMNSAACCVAYSFVRDSAHGGAWFEITNATIVVRHEATRKYVPISDELRETMLTRKRDGAQVLELKSTETPRWVQAFAQAGVKTNLHLGQKVIVKRLNAVVLHKKCIEFETEFQPLDLEGSFQRLLNRFFQHHVASSHQDYEEKLRQLRTKIRGEMKKTGRVGDTVLAYFGKGKRLNPKPTRPENFTRDALYSGRIVRVRTPFTDSKYHVTTLYDRTNKSEVPDEMEKLFAKYKVADKASWLRLPKTLRDVFLLYDVEYRHSNEIIIDEGMVRAHFRAADGDLDPVKVEESCTDANLLFKPTDLEDCVTRMAINCNGRKPLGSLRIPIKMISPHRVTDAWYPLAPENEMVQKMQLGQIRVQLRLKQISQFVRSKKTPAILEELKDAAAKRYVLAPLGPNPLKTLKDAVTPRSKRTVALPSGYSQERSFIKVAFHEARKLLPADFRMRNPFVKIVLVHESSDREEFTLMKADVKPKTLNPRWVNNEFTLGKPENKLSLLSDKRAIVLRVMDENPMLGDSPLGYVKIELRRDKAGFITDLMLVHADAQGNPTTQALHLDADNKIKVEAMLLGDERMRQDKYAKARDNNPVDDGRLGKLQFTLQLLKNENFVETAESSSPSKMVAAVVKHAETKYSAELKIKKVVAAGSDVAAVAAMNKLDWRQFSCVFQPHGEGGQRVLYDTQSEDLVQGNRHKLSDLLQQGSAVSQAASAPDGAVESAGARRFLGRTYDVSKVAYFSVQVTSDALGKTFQGKFAQQGLLKTPELCTLFQDEVIVLKDKDNKDAELRMTIDVNLVGIHRAERLKRVLAETFRLVGMPFDPKTMNHPGASAAGFQASGSANSVQAFLWEVFKVSTYPGRNVSHELLAQVHRTSRATKFHWRYTPQLLCYVYEHVFCSGEKDLLTYRDAAALDVVLTRWSQILSHVSEAKNQLIGHLHGRETPQLVQALFTTCDWTGFEFASLEVPSDSSRALLGAEPSSRRHRDDKQSGEVVFRQGDRVHASLPLCMHAGVAVDIRLRSGVFVAGTIIREFGDASFDVAFCTAAKVREESDEYFSDDDELPPLELKQSVFVCPLAKAGSAGNKKAGSSHNHSMEPGRVGTVIQYKPSASPKTPNHVDDPSASPKTPYLVEYHDNEEPKQEWIARVCLDSMFNRIVDTDIHRQLVRDDYVRVLASPDATGTSGAASRPAKVLKNHGNARYRVEYLDGQAPTLDPHVPRDRLQPLVERVTYDGVIAQVYCVPGSSATSLVVHYDVQLANGAVIEGVTREHLRARDDAFVTDRYLLGAVFAPELAVCDVSNARVADEITSDIALKIDNLWENNQVVKAYLMLPAPVASVELRHSVSNKLSQARLHERSDTTPRFVDQCHGYIRGASLKSDEASLAQLHAAALTQRQHLASSSGGAISSEDEPFDIANCVCVVLAPQPRVEIHGTMRLSASPESLGLFKAVLALALKHPMAFSALLQRPLRSAASGKVPLNRKERVLSIDRVDVFFDKKLAQNVSVSALSATCDGDVVVEEGKSTVKRESVSLKHVHLHVQFHVGVPHNSRGSLADAVKVAYQDALLILEVLTSCNGLLLADIGQHDAVADAVDAGDGVWVLEPRAAADETPAHKTRTLVVEMLDRRGEKNSKPSISLELLPLDDVRLYVKDVNSVAYDVCLSAAQLVTQAKIRRALAPFRFATVVQGPVFLASDHPKQQQIRKLSPVVPPYYQVEYSDVKKTKEAAFVSRDDMRFDVLSVSVLQVSQMFIRSAASESTSITAEVMLVSSDYEPQVASDDALKPPHGLVLTPAGEICVDMARTKYPDKSSVKLSRDHSSCVWTSALGGKNASKPIEFGHPGVDLTRVRGVRITLVDRKRDASGSTGRVVIGTVMIPMTDVALTPVWTERTYSQHLTEANAVKAGTSAAMNAASGAQIYSVERVEHGRSVVVGKITLCIKRRHRVNVNDQVEVKSYSDPWSIDAYELLVATLQHHNSMVTRGLLAAGPRVLKGGRARLTDPVEKEVQLQKIVNVMMIARAMNSIYATKATANGAARVAGTDSELTLKHSERLKSPRAIEQLKHALSQTKWIVEDTAAALGIKTIGQRVPWSSDPTHDNRHAANSDVVVVHANVATATLRLRRTILKLHRVYWSGLAPTLQRLYALDAQGDDVSIVEGEQLLRFFEEEVESLDDDDQVVYRRVYQRLRLMKIAQVLDDILCTTLRVKIMDQNPTDHDLVGLAQIPLIDLIDQEEHFNAYNLTKPNRGFNANALRIENLIDLGLHVAKTSEVKHHGKVHLRIRLTYSESALLEQAIHVYKFLKAKYIMQHETARRNINAAVVPAQRRRWATMKAYLDDLKAQATGKLHWERTPMLLSLVWDIFVSHKKATTTAALGDESELPGLSEKVAEYRDAVVIVHQRWANVQPLFDELLVIQAAPQIHAQRTSEILDVIEREVEGLDVVLSTAWQQVHHKWMVLYRALEELVEMKEKNKIHLGRAPQLLKLVLDKCSKGLSERHADAVANVQFRWMAITQPDGPLCELRLMEKTGLHWRRTHELVLLLNEQCEGFADVDARALDVVENRWKQVQEWLDDVLTMHHEHKINCQSTPFMLKQMHVLEHKTPGAHRSGGVARQSSTFLLRQKSASPSKRDLTGAGKSLRQMTGKSETRIGATSPPQSPTSATSPTNAAVAPGSVETGEVDAGRLEGLVEWYALEEVKYELERIPYHRITTDSERARWLPHSRDGRDEVLTITQQEMTLTPANVRAALEDRGVIPKYSSFVVQSGSDASLRTTPSSPSSTGATAPLGLVASTLPKDLLDEIAELELAVETMHESDARPQVLSNPERFAELYSVIESLGKTDLLWKLEHVVNTNRELDVPTNFARLLEEMELRKIPTGEIENLARTLTVVLQKEELRNAGVDVSPTANFKDVLTLMHANQVKDVSLPPTVDAIQALLQERGMDRRGEPVYLRGMRIGTQSGMADDTVANTALKALARPTTAASGSLNAGLGLIDTHAELLRKALLFEALRKRNSLIKTFPAETHVLSEQDLLECPEVDMSGDYWTLIERFQQLLIHESYTKRLASYAALDRCMRALLRVPRDQVVTKEDIAIALHGIGHGQYRLPLEAFTRDELLEAARCGKIRTPTDAMLQQCPQASNAKAMAHYAAVSYAAMVFQEVSSFSSRYDAITQRFQDALPIDAASSVNGVVIPKDRSRLNLKAYIVDWLLGSEDTAMRIERQLGAYHKQRLEWASAVFTLANRWFQRGFGWCDDASKGVGVKVLLTKLLIFEAANKMHMVQTEALLLEVNDKCVSLRSREKAAKETLEQRYKRNVEMLEKLVTHAEKCMNNRKLHSEETPALLHAIEQVCVVPQGLSPRHMEAYHVVTSHWIPHRARLDELVQMHKEGTFSIHRTPELLSAMEFHTEGIAGATELDEESVYAMASESGDMSGNQQDVLERKIDEIRRGQRKMPSSLHLDLNDLDAEQEAASASTTDAQDWKSLSPSKRLVQPLSPHEKQTSWRVVTKGTPSGASTKQTVVLETKSATGTASVSGASSPRRKSSLGEELKELLKSPAKWLLETTEPVERIRPEFFFPQAVSHDSSFIPAAPTQ